VIISILHKGVAPHSCSFVPLWGEKELSITKEKCGVHQRDKGQKGDHVSDSTSFSRIGGGWVVVVGGGGVKIPNYLGRMWERIVCRYYFWGGVIRKKNENLGVGDEESQIRGNAPRTPIMVGA